MFYGLDYLFVDGMIWYLKLNGNWIGRIDFSVEDGDIKEWNLFFCGFCCLYVVFDGVVWVLGFGFGVFGKFDLESEMWIVYELFDVEN